MRSIIYILGISAFILACSGSLEEVEERNELQNKLEQYTVLKGTDTKHGEYKRMTLDGELLETAQFEDGLQVGEQKIYENGELYSIANFKNGQHHGLYQTFYRGGQVNVEGEYVDNVMTGKWKSYYPDGQIKEVVTFEDNEENGPFVEFYPNGNVKAEGEYLDGDNEHGELMLYDINGILIKKMMCDKGICRTTWVKEGRENFDVYRGEDG
ncbi:MAG: toxin-antitoxin system YwqK family antitoxin [Saprospiraceae bacterium]|nr:toxin-antitoxin system YwqK family antitoxin [Saprospiraceae bacterium]